MADSAITDLSSVLSPASTDRLLITRDPNGTPVSKQISVKDLFGNIPANTSISGITTLSANLIVSGSNTVFSSNVNITSSKGPKVTAPYITIATKSTVSSNNATTQLGASGLQGSIFWDENYLYLATANNNVKRVALSTF
jgi:hypothetical protein